MANPRPYKPSWIDGLLDWIDSLPITGMPFFVALYALLVLAAHVALWLEGLLPFGEFNSTIAFDVIWIPFALGYIYLMEQAAKRSIEEFRPALTVSDKEYEQIAYRFTTLRPVTTLLLSIAGLALGLIVVLNTPFVIPNGQNSASRLVWALLSGGGYAFAPVWFYAAIRHIVQINQLYARVKSINLFNLHPLYGLARVSMIIGGFFVFAANMNYLWELFLGTQTQSFATVIGFSLGVLVVALIVFVVPLLGIHRKIEDEKRNMLAKLAEQIESLRLRLQAELRKTKMANVQDLEKALSATFALRTNIQAVPTWPWSPGSFRNFASAITLPLLIWVIQRVLSPIF